MKKRIFAVLLAAAMLLSLAVFASCTKESAKDEEDDEGGESVSITVRVKITDNNGKVLADEELPMTNVQSELTALAATIRALEIVDIKHVEEDGFIQSIGDYDGTDAASEGETAEVAYLWEFSLNGKVPDEGGARDTLLKDGDLVEWNYVKFE